MVGLRKVVGVEITSSSSGEEECGDLRAILSMKDSHLGSRM